MFYIIAHDTYFKLVLMSAETSLHGAKRPDVSYVGVAPRWRPFQLSLLLYKGVVLSPTSLSPAASDPPIFQKPIEQHARQMKRRMVVSANRDRRAKNNQSLSDIGTCSYGGENRVREFLQELTSLPKEFSFEKRTPNLVESCQDPRP